MVFGIGTKGNPNPDDDDDDDDNDDDNDIIASTGQLVVFGT